MTLPWYQLLLFLAGPEANEIKAKYLGLQPAEGDTLHALREDLARHLIVYAEWYEEDFPTFFHAPNRKAHYPYVLHVLCRKMLRELST